MAYEEDEYLQLSGLQHYAYCPRQWALIALENQWMENVRTVEGKQLHERAHDANLREKRGDLLVVRSMSVHSSTLGVSGQCDVVEFHRDASGISLSGEEGTWLPVPVEYKRGQPKISDADRLQLCCQAMCIEEMLCCAPIATASLYYGETAHREKVTLDDALRDKVAGFLAEMHRLTQRGYTPKRKPDKGCNACSLREVCLPRLMSRPSVSAYIAQRLKEDEEHAQAE
ncbi:MAG: CRISPR-associated protein Cas4 [Clostridia bacterium]